MQGKNSGSGVVCTKKFCAANSEQSSTIVPAKIAAAPSTATPAVAPAKTLAVDPGTVQRNRELRRIKDTVEAAKQHTVQYMPPKPVAGPAEITKLRLILTLQKYQSLGIDYTMISQYFADSIKPLDQGGDGNIDTIKEILIYDRDALKDSAGCYASALAAVQKARSGTFAVIGTVVDGLADALKGLGGS